MYYVENSKRANTVDSDEMALYEPSHLDLQCLQNSAIVVFDALRVKYWIYMQILERSNFLGGGPRGRLGKVAEMVAVFQRS